MEKKAAHASEQDRPDILRRREAWFENQLDLDPEKLVFIDETWASTSMARNGPKYEPPPRPGIVEFLPGTPVKLDSEEADRLIERGIAKPWPPVESPKPALSVEEAEQIERSFASQLAYAKAVDALAKEEAANTVSAER